MNPKEKIGLYNEAAKALKALMLAEGSSAEDVDSEVDFELAHCCSAETAHAAILYRETSGG